MIAGLTKKSLYFADMKYKINVNTLIKHIKKI